MSHAQRNHELRNYESSGEHSITSSPRTQAAGATPDPLRSSLRELQALQRSRACGLSHLRLRRSYFTITGLVRPMSMLQRFVLQRSESCQLDFASAKQQFRKRSLGDSDHAVRSCLLTILPEPGFSLQNTPFWSSPLLVFVSGRLDDQVIASAGAGEGGR